MPWKYYLPEGGYYLVADDVTEEEMDDLARQKHPEQFTPAESTVKGSFVKGLKTLGSDVQELAEIPFKGVDEAAERAARRERALTEEYGTGASFEDLGKTYEEEGLFSAAGELARQSAMAVAGSLPYMAEIGGAAMVGGLPGLVAGAYAPRLASNLSEQAAVQRAKGEPVDVDVAEAAGYAAPMAALDIAAQAIPLGKTAAGKIFGPEVEKLLTMGTKTEAEKAAADVIASGRGIWSSMLRGSAKNLVAQEFIQPAEIALGRLQSDEDLLSDEALAQYGEAMYMAGIMSPLGAIEGVSERSAARGRIADRALRAEEEKPGIDEATGQETLAPGLFKEAEGAEQKSRFGRVKAEMEKALKRKLTDAETETLRTEIEGELTAAETEAPEEVGPSRQMGLELRPQEMEEQRDLFGGKEPEQPGTQLDLFAEPEERGEAPVYTREQAVRELTQRLEETEGRAPTKEELAEAYESAPAAQPDTSQMEMPFTGIQESLGLEEPTTPKQYDLEAEAQQRAVEEPITARNQVEREATRKIELEKYIGENEGQMPLPFDDIGGKRPEETTPVETPVEQSPEQIAKAKAIEAIIGADKATIQLVKDATGYSSAKAKDLLDQLTAEGVLAKPDGTTARKVLMPVKQLEMKLDELLPARTPSAGEQIEMFSPEETYANKPFTIKDLSDEALADVYGSKQPESTVRYKEALPRSEWEKEAPSVEPKRFEERLEDTATTTPHSGQEWLPGTEPRWQHLYDTEAEAQQRAAGEALAQRRAEEPVNAPVIEANTERPAGTVGGERLNERRVPTSDDQSVQSRGTRESSVKTAGGKRLVINKPNITESTERTGTRPAALDIATQTRKLEEQQATIVNKQKAQQSEAIARSQAANDFQERLDEIIDSLHPKVADRVQNAIDMVRRGSRTAAEVEHVIKNAETKVSGVEEPTLPTVPKVGLPVSTKKSVPTMEDFLAKVEGYRKGSTEPKTQLGTGLDAGVHVDKVRSIANAVVSKWKNAPKVNVVQSIADLPGHLQVVDARAKGLYDPSTQTVHIIADNAHTASPEASVKATVFHESLGHFGLERAFGDGLDALLNNLHKTNRTVRERTNAWLERNPDAYKDSADRTARAVEEVFAEMSERGELEKAPTGLHLAFTKIADFIGNFLERIGLKQKDYTKADRREIFDTLRRAHESVTGEREAAEKIRAGKIEPRYQLKDDIPPLRAAEIHAVTSTPSPNQKRTSSTFQRTLEGLLERHGDKPTVATIVNTLSKMPADMFNLWNKAQTQFGIERTYGHLSKNLPVLTDHIAMMATNKYEDLIDAEKTIGSIRDTVYKAVKNQSRRVQTEFNSLVDDLTITQADIWDLDAKTHTFTNKKDVATFVSEVRSGKKKLESLSAQAQQLYRVASRYYALPKEVQDAARQYFGYFNKLSERGMSYAKRLALDNIKDEALAKKIMAKHAIGDLKYYVPRTREGSYVLKFTDKDGGRYTSQHESPAARALARKRIEAEGAKEISEEVRDPRNPRDRLAPAGLLGEILESVKKTYELTPAQMASMSEAEITAHNAKFNSVANAIYDGMLSFMPNQVIKDARGRTIIELADGTKQYGYRGAEQDAIKVFTDEVPGLIYQINKVRWGTKLDDAYTEVRKDMLGKVAEGKAGFDEAQIRAVLDNLAKRIDFSKNPTYNKFVNWNSKANYYWSIAGNVSSGLTNTTVLPMFVAPNLAGKYGTAKTTKAMSLATKLYPAFREFDKHDLVDGEHSAQHRTAFSDAIRHIDLSEFGVTTEDLAKLHKYLLERSATGNSTLHELRASQISRTGYEKVSDQANRILAFAMKESEQFNRGVTHLSSFLLDMDARRGETDAVNKASREAYLFNGEMNGSAAHETNSSLYQSNWGRVLLTFRTFPLNMAIQTAKVFKAAVAEVAGKGEEARQVRTIARRQLLGIMAMTYAFAGVKGLPLYGMANVLASLLYDDEDEPYDLDQEIIKATGGTVGLNGVMSQVLGVAIADRTGFNGILFRDDPKRLAEVGYVDYIAERGFGPTIGILQGFGRAHDAMKTGNYERALEYAAPASLRNILKGIRYATEGARTLDGDPIKEHVGVWGVVNQVLGYTPTDIGEIMTQTSATKAIDVKLENRKSILLTQLNAARTAGDIEEMRNVMQKINVFKAKNPGVFKPGTIEASFKRHDEIARQTVNGLYLPKSRLEAARRYVIDTTDEE